ncbi:putative GTP-binding protein EngB [compost metagenome]
MLTGKKGLAKTSQTPGKTQLINHFQINNNWFLVDLPGYGFARVSKTSAEKWGKFIRQYLSKRENLQCVMVLVDSRLEPQKIDLQFIDSLGELGLPFVIVFTKSDKQSKGKTAQNVQLFKNELLKTWEEVPQLFVTSAEDKSGREELLEFIDSVNQSFNLDDIQIKSTEDTDL